MHHHDHARLSATIKLLRPLTDHQIFKALDGAPQAAIDASCGRATLPRARLALAVHHQADLHLCSDSTALAELIC